MAKQTFKIINGVYSGPEVWEGNLDLHGYKETLTSLGSLTKVGNRLDLEGCTSLVSLGSLTEVRFWLDLEGCTCLVSLGALTTVGGCVFLGGEAPRLQEVQEKISYYSSLPLHEALNALHTDEVQKVPLYKNILLKSLQGEGISSL
jgi:hypothetical protein